MKKCGSNLTKSSYLKDKMFCHSCRNWYDSDEKTSDVEELVSTKVLVKTEASKRPDPCPFHPKYKGKRYPVNDCAVCWELYNFNSKKAVVL